MKKVTERIMLVMLIILGVIIMVLAALVGMTVNPELGFFGVPSTNLIFIVLAVAYLAISIYLLVRTFSNIGNVRRLLIYADRESSIRTSIKVVKKLIAQATNGIDGVKILKVKVFELDNGAALRIRCEIKGEQVNERLAQLRAQIEALFTQIFRLSFLTIEFDVVKVKYTGKLPTSTDSQQDMHETDNDSKQANGGAGQPFGEKVEVESQPKTQGDDSTEAYGKATNEATSKGIDGEEGKDGEERASDYSIDGQKSMPTESETETVKIVINNNGSKANDLLSEGDKEQESGQTVKDSHEENADKVEMTDDSLTEGGQESQGMQEDSAKVGQTPDSDKKSSGKK